jgi:serine protease Do
MKHMLRLFLTVLALTLPLPLAADPADIAASSRSVVRVVLVGEIREDEFDDSDPRTQVLSHGSGIVVAPGLILTNAHVVEELEGATTRLLVVPPEGNRGYFGTVIAIRPDKDLALVQFKGGSLPIATLSPQTVPDGANVVAVGYPGNVDMAQGLNALDMIMPQPPVKTQGTSSAGRASKSFDTVLHTAPIAGGNSGGPLFDGCGRVVGINSFGTYNEDASGADFFFAVSMREVLGFLREQKVKAQVASLPCQSMADFNRAEAERLAGDKAAADASARADADKLAATREQAEKQAQLAIISERENGMALAGFALILALAAAGGAAWLQSQGRKQHAAYAGGAAGVLLLISLYAWFARPGLDEIGKRTDEIVASKTPAAAPSEAAKAAAGKLICVLEPARSRVTVSPVTDVPLEWRADGCVNTRTQYGLASDGWSRILVPNEDQTVTVARFDPATGAYTTERFLLDFEAMTKAREERAKFTPPICGVGEEGARRLGESQAAIKALLPPQPNERMVYKCRAGAGVAASPPAP